MWPSRLTESLGCYCVQFIHEGTEVQGVNYKSNRAIYCLLAARPCAEPLMYIPLVHGLCINYITSFNPLNNPDER